MSFAIDDRVFRKTEFAESGGFLIGSRGVRRLDNTRRIHLIIRILERDEQRHIATDGVSAFAHRTVAYHHNHLRRRIGGSGIGLIKISVQLVRTLNPESSLAIIRHEFCSDSYIGCKTRRLISGTKRDIALRDTAVCRGVPSAQLITIGRRSG